MGKKIILAAATLIALGGVARAAETRRAEGAGRYIQATFEKTGGRASKVRFKPQGVFLESNGDLAIPGVLRVAGSKTRTVYFTVILDGRRIYNQTNPYKRCYTLKPRQNHKLTLTANGSRLSAGRMISLSLGAGTMETKRPFRFNLGRIRIR